MIEVLYLVARVNDFITTLNTVTSSPLSVKKNPDDSYDGLREENCLEIPFVSESDCASTGSRTPKSSVQSTPTGTFNKHQYNIRSKFAHPHPLKDFLQSFSSYDKRLEISNEFNKLELEDNTYHVKEYRICQNQSPEMDR